MRSPIKSIIRNKTNSYYRNRLASNVALNLAPCGQDGDSAEFLGDVFSMIDLLGASELLMGSVLSGNIEITYVVDSVVAVSKNTGKPNYRGSAKTYDAIEEANGYKKPTVEVKKVVAPVAQVAEPKKVEAKPTPVVVEEPKVEETPVVEPVKVEEKPAETVTEEPKAEEKPRRQRKIKVD
jgi:hypothetical protein